MFGRQILKNTAVQTVGKVIIVGLSFFTLTLTTRYLGPEQYGVLATVAVFLSFFAVSSDLGLSLFGLRELAQSKKDAGHILSSLFSLRLIMALVSMGAALLIALLLGYSSEAVRGVAIMAPTLIFNTVTSALSVYFQHKLHMRYVVIGEVISKAASLAGLLFIIQSKMGLDAFFWLNVVTAIVFCATVYWFARSHIRLRLVYDPAYWRTAIWLSIPLGLTTILNSIYYRLDTILLSLLDLANSIVPSISNFQAVGLYSVPYRLIEIIMIFPGLFIVSIFPVMAMQSELGDTWRTRTQRAYNFLILLAVPLVLFVWLFAAQIIHVLAGNGYEVSADLLKILIVAVAISFLNALLGYLLVARHHEKAILKLAVFTISVNLILNLILIPRFSFYAATWTTILSEALGLAISLWLVQRHFHFLPSPFIGAKSFFAALIACVPVYWLAGIQVQAARESFVVLMAAAIVFAAVYFAMLIPLRALSLKEVRETLQLPAKNK
jgi:O-antigen/teichoic acid export membrane protein